MTFCIEFNRLINKLKRIFSNAKGKEKMNFKNFYRIPISRY